MRNLTQHLLVSFTFFPFLTASLDLITTTQFLTQDQILVSPTGEFELGFFSPGRSNNWYIGIWYKKIEVKTFVWVGNRDVPLRNSSGVLQISAGNGDLVLVDDSGKLVWSANYSLGGNTVAELLDSGNLVLRLENDADPENYLWQSFDHPTDTLLPGMKLGWDSKTGLNRYLNSWKSADDPSVGEYSFKLDIYGFPEIYLTHKEEIVYRSGPWNGIGFSGVPEMKPSTIVSFLFKMNPDEVFYSFELHNNSVYSRLTVSYSGPGALQRFTWIPTSKIWNLFWYAPKDQCDDYKECGVYGLCDPNLSPICKCIKGFKPKNPQAWNLRDGSEGCVRLNALNCKNDGFLTLNNMKLPDSATSFVDPAMNLDQCQQLCKRNCSCQGYSSSNITNGGSGCAIWTSALYDTRQYTAAEGGQSFYVRVAAPDSVTEPVVLEHGNSSNKKRTLEISGISTGIGILLLSLGIFFLWKKKGKSKTSQGNILEHRVPRSQDFLMSSPTIPSTRDYTKESAAEELELPLLDFDTIVAATKKFF